MKSSSRVPSLDGWRALSIILVLLGHEIKMGGAFGFTEARDQLSTYFGWHYYGVQIFFVISGFIITYLLLQEEKATGTISFRMFYLRRFFRIIPALGTYLACVFLLNLIFHGETIGPVAWFKSIFFLGNFSFGGSPWSTGHLWSLSVEEQYYFFWPLVFFHKRLRTFLPVLFILLGPFFRVIDYRYLGSIGVFSFFTRGDSILIGSLFAIYRDHPAFTKALKFSNPILIVTAFCLIAEKLLIPNTAFLTVPFTMTFFSLSVVVLITRSFSPNSVLFRILNTRGLIWIGGISYSLYLWQQLFFPVSVLGLMLPTLFPFNFMFAFLFAWLSSRFIEKPILAWRRRRYDRTTGGREMVVGT
jgi:peptidoglycan/LPS O-acetylase OafA/YrhL